VPELEVSRSSPLMVGHFHLGGDIDTGAGAASDEVTALLKRPTRKFLVVGTVEPRKGHAQCLAAFEELWAAGKDIDLVVVGKQGWMVDDLAERMRNHAEAGKRLHWFAKASDADLNALYEKCTALLAMSQDEGFGLPLIEAAKHGLPIIARDILVFREIAGEHAAYFSGSRGSDFASALSAWIDRHGRGDVPASVGMPWLTWAGSAERLVDVVLHGDWDAAWAPGQAVEDLSPADMFEDRVGEGADDAAPGDAAPGAEEPGMAEAGGSSRLARRA
jgi:glycosyltransferase involved in cell wall biosynthesis